MVFVMVFQKLIIIFLHNFISLLTFLIDSQVIETKTVLTIDFSNINLFLCLHRYFSIFLVPNQVMCIVFALLPILWVIGILPPIDAILLWVMEQVHVLLLGGSPMASGTRYHVHTIILLFISSFFYIS